MKSKKNTPQLFLAATLFVTCLLATFGAKAQVIANPYTVTNALDCSVDISYTFYHASGGCVPCGSPGTTNIAFGATANLYKPSACGTICNVVITLTTINSQSIGTPVSVDYNNPIYNNGTCTACNPCDQFYLSWGTGNTIINY